MPSGHIYAPRGENPDVELIALCRRYMVMEEAYNRCFEEMLAAEERGDQAAEDAFSKEQDIRAPVMRDLLFDIMDIPARTAEGAKAKATAALTRVQRDRDGYPYGLEDAVMDSLASDILYPAFALSTDSPFALLLEELSTVTARYLTAWDTCGKLLHQEGTPELVEAKAAEVEYEAMLSRIAALPARDPLGMVLKAAIILRELENFDLNRPEGEVARSLRADLARNFPQIHQVVW
ncbi:hypothetical protein D9598_09285 [Roseomonas sp. KE0001]|nr:hypothetical protein [Roseomonas sp. KE0001]